MCGPFEPQQAWKILLMTFNWSASCKSHFIFYKIQLLGKMGSGEYEVTLYYKYLIY
jgi:hypothetical protein